MSKLETALKLIEQDFREKFIDFDEDGDEYLTASQKDTRHYRKLIDTLKYLTRRV
jgi:hypothetical protein